MKVKPKPFLSKKAKRRKLWLSVHRWIGIILLIPMAALGVTGSALVWPDKTELIAHPDRAPAAVTADPAIVTEAAIATAREALSEFGPVAALRIGAPGQALMAGTTPHKPPHWGIGPPTRMTAFVDPDSGKLLSVNESTGDFMWYMRATHGHLLLKGIGRPVTGIVGIFLLISAISGLYVWWPGTKRIWAAFKWQKREGKALNLHKQSGIILSLVLIVEAFTGMWISFPTIFSQLVEPGTDYAGHQHARGPSGDVLATQDANWPQVLGIAQSEYPGRPVMVAAPTDESKLWRVMLIGEKGPAIFTVTHDNTRDFTITYEDDGATPASEAEHVMEGIHYAHIGGPLWQWIIFISGFVMTFLSLTGIYIWGKRELFSR